MRATHKRLMREYMEQHGGAVEIGKECDVCWAKVGGRMSLRKYLCVDKDGQFTSFTPNLCPDHGRELGVAW